MKKVGSWYLPDKEQHLIKYIKRTDSYQAEHRLHALKFVKKQRLAIDIGAHVGLWAKDLALVFKKVYAFEPCKEHIECFDENVTYKYKNVSLLPFGLSDTEKIVSYYPRDITSTGGTNTILDKNGAHTTKLLDSFNFTQVDFIKVDVEGHEAHVLRGGEKTILKSKPVINIEQKFNYDAKDYLLSIGATLLGNYKDEWVFGF